MLSLQRYQETNRDYCSVKPFNTARFRTVRSFLMEYPKVNFGFELSGSWKNNEQHKLASDKCTISFSDIDFLAKNPISALDESRFRQHLAEILGILGVRIAGVSVRAREDMRAMWIPPKTTDGNLGASEYFLFWVSLAYVSSSIGVRQFEDVLKYSRPYFANKWLCHLLWTYSSLRNSAPKDYSNLIFRCSIPLSSQFKSEIYQIKTGCNACVISEKYLTDFFICIEEICNRLNLDEVCRLQVIEMGTMIWETPRDYFLSFEIVERLQKMSSTSKLQSDAVERLKNWVRNE